ncbi:MAG: ATP-binding protein [Pseudomonadota bacterium]|nr:ATP-binding protein [Pseudomonadota bacterium]
MTLPATSSPRSLSPSPVETLLEDIWSQLRCDPHLARELARRLIERSGAARPRTTSPPASRLQQHPFLAHVSHEMRAPLNGLLGVTALLSRSQLDSRQRRLVTLARTSAEVLLRLVNDILDLARMESGHFLLDPQPFAFEPLLTDAVEMFRTEAEQKGLGLVLRLGPGLPRIALGDRLRVRQVLTNLVGNAVKFTAHGQVRIEVSRRPGGTLRFEVHDTGRGLTEEAQARLFAEFVQEDARTAREYGGTGLGLAVSRQLVWLMQGDIGVHSTPGRGSTFWFELNLPDA